MKGFLPFKGFLCPGIYFSSKYCIWLMQWTSTPTEVEAFSEIWVFTPEDNRTAYIDPVEAIPIFKIYHDFNDAVEAEIIWDFNNTGSISANFRASDNTVMEIHLKLGPTIDINAFNDSETETGMKVRHHSNSIAVVESASGTLNGIDLGKISKPSNPINLGSSQVPDTPLVSFCTHFLESR